MGRNPIELIVKGTGGLKRCRRAKHTQDPRALRSRRPESKHLVKQPEPMGGSTSPCIYIFSVTVSSHAHTAKNPGASIHLIV